MPKIYKLSLKLTSGLLSELQSDTIFGHFCWRLKETLGEVKLSEFLQLYNAGNPVFTLSDGILEKDNELFFPKPLLQTPYKMEATNKYERIKSFLELKEQKDKKLITVDQLNHYINNRLDKYAESFQDEYNSKLKYPSFIKDVRMHVQIDRENFAAAEGQLFPAGPQYIDTDTYIAVLIKIINRNYFDENKFEEILKSVFTLGYGKKKSSGYGTFEVKEYGEFDRLKEPSNPNGFIVLGNYLPSQNDFIKDAYYSTNVKYGLLGEEYSNSQNPFKKPILFLTSGSCFFTDTKKDFYGRCTNKGEITDYLPNVVQNGIPFTLNALFD